MLLISPHRRLSLPRLLGPAECVLVIGLGVLLVPTMINVARFSWSTEQGGHGPIVLATGLWLLHRELTVSKAVSRPGAAWLGFLWLGGLLTVFVLAHITGILEIEAFAVYGAVIAAAYLLVGGPLLRSIWFPLVYLAFTLPPPDSFIAAVTQPIKIAISAGAVSLLHWFGYPIASSGVVIQIAQYELLVAAACAGLNSLVTLAAICLFYVYLRHQSNLLAFIVVALAVIPVAIFSNFIRVLVLILITYYYGESAAQGFMHDFAGLLMFGVSVVAIFVINSVFTRFTVRPRAEV